MASHKKKMSGYSFFKGVLAGAGMVIGLLVLLFFAMPYIQLCKVENEISAQLRSNAVALSGTG